MTRRFLIAVTFAVLVSGVGGYLLGHSSAPDPAMASDEQADAHRLAEVGAVREAAVVGRARGRKLGMESGQAAGVLTGRADGRKRGSAAAQRAITLAELAAAEEAAAVPPPEVCGSYEACQEPDAILNAACPPGQVIVYGACQPPPPGYTPGNLLPGDSE